MAIDITRWNGTSGYPILKLNKASEVTAVSKSAAFTVELTGGDYKTVILMANAGNASANVTFEAGDSAQAAGGDLTVAVGASKTAAIVLDSGYFKKMYGTDNNSVKITPSAAVSFTVFELPQ